MVQVSSGSGSGRVSNYAIKDTQTGSKSTLSVNRCWSTGILWKGHGYDGQNHVNQTVL